MKLSMRRRAQLMEEKEDIQLGKQQGVPSKVGWI